MSVNLLIELSKKEWRLTRILFFVFLSFHIFVFVSARGPGGDPGGHLSSIFNGFITPFLFFVLLVFSVLKDSKNMKRWLHHSGSMKGHLAVKIIIVLLEYLALLSVVATYYIFKYYGWLHFGTFVDFKLNKEIYWLYTQAFDSPFVVLAFLTLFLFAIYHSIKHRFSKLITWFILLFSFIIGAYVSIIIINYFHGFLFNPQKHAPGLFKNMISSIAPYIEVIVAIILYYASSWILDHKAEA